MYFTSAGEDFSPINQTLTFSNEVRGHQVTIAITNDGLVEETEDFITLLSLSGEDTESGTVLLVHPEALVSIEDDDSEFTSSLCI